MTSDFLRSAARYVFFGALIIAPWYYGATTATSILIVNWVLGASLLLFVIELFVNRRLPRVPWGLVLLVAALMLIGAWMTLNARSVYDAEFGTFTPVDNIAPTAPGSVDYVISFAWMIRGALLLLSILFVVDLSRDGKSLIQLWQTIGIAGGSIALLGLLQKATNAEAIFWQKASEGYGKTFFATYYYHANAGALLNLTLPFTAGLALRAFVRSQSQAVRSLWVTVFLLNLAAIASNTSRGAQLVGGIIVLALLVQLTPPVFRGLSKGKKNVALAGAAAILLALYAIGQASHLEKPLEHWRQTEVVSQDARWLATRVASRALTQAGPLGFGPGAFRTVFPMLNRQANNLAGPGTWRFLHEDYLQTILEWGWVGAALWGALFVGGGAVALLSLRKQRELRKERKAKGKEPSGEREWSWRRRLIVSLAIIALGGVALHAIVDFPLQIESIQLYVATYLALCWGSATWGSRR